MKIRNLLLTGILGILTAATAGAQTKIFITGAPAIRSYVSRAIYNVLASSTSGAITYAFSGTGVTSASAFANSNAITFYGGNVTVNGTADPVTVEISYVGSSSGIQDVASSGTANFLPNGATPAGSPYADPTTAGNAGDEEFPIFTASDEFQASTPWDGVNTLTGPSVTYQALESDIAGVIPYRFVASPDAPARLTNISLQQAQVLWETGYIWLSTLTGSTSDNTEAIYALGRNPGSGLRTVLLSETGIGVGTLVKQFEPTVSGTAAPYVATAQVRYPAGTVNGVSLPVGDNGYSSFGSLDPAISAYTITNGGSLVGSGVNYPATAQGATSAIYVTALADADAQTAIKNGAHELSYNGFYLAGVPYTGSGTTGLLPSGGGASPNLANGQYTFWSYIQLQYQSSLATESLTPTSSYPTAEQLVARPFEQALYQDLGGEDAAVLLQNMNVNRQQDGGNIYEGNPY
jgi:hypothetical protein